MSWEHVTENEMFIFAVYIIKLPRMRRSFLYTKNIKHQTYFKRVFYRLKHTLIYATKNFLQMQRIFEQSQNNRAKFILFSLKHTSVTAYTPASMCARVN